MKFVARGIGREREGTTSFSEIFETGRDPRENLLKHSFSYGQVAREGTGPSFEIAGNPARLPDPPARRRLSRVRVERLNST